MKEENEKYNRILDLIKRSEPDFDSKDEVEEEVIRRISKQHQSGVNFNEILDFMFGWVYIGWVRRTLISASAALVILFVYQQGIILKQINFLSRQIIVDDGGTISPLSGSIEKRLLMYKLSGRRFPSNKISISEKELKNLLESVTEMEDKFKDLQNLIDNDPELKSYIEKKLEENNRTNINL